jgi:PadR family transcriptional regulator, regulatory protein PadR
MGSGTPVVKGTLDVLVLKALSWNPMHGYEITRWVEDHSGGRIDVEDSALYQALYRLEERSFIDPEWRVTENNRRARYYRITRTGRVHLRREAARLQEYAAALTAVLQLESGS